MMLADPRRMETDLFGVDRLADNVGDETVGTPTIVHVVIVAEREMTELH